VVKVAVARTSILCKHQHTAAKPALMHALAWACDDDQYTTRESYSQLVEGFLDLHFHRSIDITQAKVDLTIIVELAGLARRANFTSRQSQNTT
jgi:hypothetical protein